LLPFLTTKSNVASIKWNVASTLLLVASTQLLVWMGLNFVDTPNAITATPNYLTYGGKKKVKASHTPYRALGPEQIQV